MKRKTNISVVDRSGTRRHINIEVGVKGSNVSGDILDANAIEQLVSEKVSDLVDLAPETLDTLGEIASGLDSKQDVIEDLENIRANSTEALNDVETIKKQIDGIRLGDVLFDDGAIKRGSDIAQYTDYGHTGIAICVAEASKFPDGCARFANFKIKYYQMFYPYSSTGGDKYGLFIEANGKDVQSQYDGLYNTNLIREYSEGIEHMAVDNAPGDDWYIPAPIELQEFDKNKQLIYSYLDVVHPEKSYVSSYYISNDHVYCSGINSPDWSHNIFNIVYFKKIKDFTTSTVENLKSSNIVLEYDGLYQNKDEEIYPVSHPDLSTQPSVLPQRYGNLKIYEVLVPLGSSFIDVEIDNSYIPADATILECSVFNKEYKLSAYAEKYLNKWKITGYGFKDTGNNDDWIALVRYTCESLNYGRYY